MNITRKIDRAMQWAGEKMGAEAKAIHTEEFKALEAEMDVRHSGVNRLHRSMSIYTKWFARRCDGLEDKSRSTPLALLGRNMVAHGAEFEQDSEFGLCLAAMGSVNEHIAELQSSYIDCANATWLQQLERNLAMMKEYESARKKLESRRLAYDASMGKMQKAKKDDSRLEEELCANKTKFDDTTEDVFQRMQDIKEAEVDTVAALSSFLDAELEYHEQAANELCQLRRTWGANRNARHLSSQEGSNLERIYSNASVRSQHFHNTAVAERHEGSRVPTVKLTRTLSTRAAPPPPPPPPSRPPALRSATFEVRHTPITGAKISRGMLARAATDMPTQRSKGEDVFADDASTCSGDNSPRWGDDSISPATSYGSLHGQHPNTLVEGKKAPPPVNRTKKPPPPPIPRKVSNLGH